MRKVYTSRFWLAAGLTAAGALTPAWAATETPPPRLAEIEPAGVRMLGDTAEMMLRYIQEDGPESGHVRVVLTPETRSLTIVEARMAAEQAFLATLKEPSLGDDLRRVTVVVRLMPASYADPAANQQVVVYLHKSGNDWSVLSGSD